MAQDQLFDEIHLHDEHSSSHTHRPLLLFFIPGNPGMIEYYRDYLSYLYALLRKQHPHLNLHIYGTSLLGFEIHQPKPDDSVVTHPGPYDLEDQIAHLSAKLQRIATTISSAITTTTTEHEPLLRTIIAGHSVGSWLTLELASRALSTSPSSPPSSYSSSSIEIQACVALFPTIYDLALSPRGRIAKPILLLPGVLLFLHYLVVLLTLLPDALLHPLVALCASMPARGACVTTAFLRCRGGVYQALFLAKDELAVIGAERESSWSEELWAGGGLGTGRRKAPRLFFYWGASDGYIAPVVRARVIAARGMGAGGSGKAVMVVDEHGTDHAFCVEAEGNRHVASSTAEFLENILSEAS
nr:lipid droplet-associated hydrolase [Quercus suber]